MNALSLKTNIVLALLRLIAHLPFGGLYVISDVICFLMQHILHYRKRVIFENLYRSFPEKEETEIKQIANNFYSHLCDCIVESIKLLHISDIQLEHHITVRNSSKIEELASDGRPIIVFLGHYGNWEWVQEVTRHYRNPAINAEIYRPINNKVIDNIMLAVRSRFPTRPIPQKNAIRELLRMHHNGTQFLVGFISDQRPNSKNLYHWTSFLNQDTAFATGGEEIGNHLKAHFVYLDIEKSSRGQYIMTFQNIIVKKEQAEPYPYTIKFLQMMEQTIRRKPEYWLWSHNRWKFDREGNTIHKNKYHYENHLCNSRACRIIALFRKAIGTHPWETHDTVGVRALLGCRTILRGLRRY